MTSRPSDSDASYLAGPVNGWLIHSKGTVVATSSYAIARSSEVYPVADRFERFEPERWFNATVEMRNMSRALSYGLRNCIGSHLAPMIHLTVAKIFQIMDLTLDSSMTDETMLPRNRGDVEPAGGKLYVNIDKFC